MSSGLRIHSLCLPVLFLYTTREVVHVSVSGALVSIPERRLGD